MAGLASMSFDGSVYIMCNEDGSLCGFKNSAEAAHHFERSYLPAHGRGYERSMSACVHYIMFQPKVHDVPDVQGLVGPVIRIPFRAKRLSCVAGSLCGVLCEGDEAKKWHDSGTAPELIEME